MKLDVCFCASYFPFLQVCFIDVEETLHITVDLELPRFKALGHWQLSGCLYRKIRDKVTKAFL